MAERPLSPHFSVYKFTYTMALSILHRITGVALAVGLIGFIGWLMAAALGEGAYATVYAVLASLPFKILIAFAVLALAYHFCNGLRHLAWDMGWGFERAQARRSAAIVVAAALIVAAICIYFVFRSNAGAA